MENLKCEIDNRGVATVTLNRPQLHNAFNQALIKELVETFTRLGSDESVRLAVLTGEGKSFCAGADINWMSEMVQYSVAENLADSRELQGLFEVLNSFPKPLVGKVNGAALGGGSGLVAVCDIVVAREEALFGFTEVRLGLLPAVISPFVIAKIGESHARALFLTGERIGPERAKEIGLIHQVSLERYFERDVDAVISSLLKAAPKAQCAAKELVNFVVHSGQSREEVKEGTCQRIAKIRVSPEGQEGMHSLLEKRKPAWLGGES